MDQSPLLLVAGMRTGYFSRKQVLTCIKGSFYKEEKKNRKAYDRSHKKEAKQQKSINKLENDIREAKGVLKKLRERQSGIECMENRLEEMKEEEKELMTFKSENCEIEVQKRTKEINALEKRIIKAKNQKRNHELKRKIEEVSREEEDFSMKKRKEMEEMEEDRKKSSGIIETWEKSEMMQTCMKNTVEKLSHLCELREIKLSIQEGKIRTRIITSNALKVLVQKNLLKGICYQMLPDFWKSFGWFMEVREIQNILCLLRGTCSNLYWAVAQHDIETEKGLWRYVTGPPFCFTVFKKI